jgi:nucleotide-binding universal stress UspA family protein
VTIQRVLVAVDDSPAALRAALVALDLAAGWHASVLLVNVSADHVLGRLLDTTTPANGVTDRVEESGRAILRHVTEIAEPLGVAVDAVQLAGEPFREILEQAQSWKAELIVMGLSDRRGPSSPYVGSVAAHVLEFSECPVLVVPRDDTADRSSQ